MKDCIFAQSMHIVEPKLLQEVILQLIESNVTELLTNSEIQRILFLVIEETKWSDMIIERIDGICPHL